MSDRPLTSGQIAVLKSLQDADPGFGRLSGSMVRGRRAAWARPKLEALARRGFAERHATNPERWFATPDGRAVDLSSIEHAS